jgi:UDP-N-acetyl-D-mannosaminuronic acid dehydrogenase
VLDADAVVVATNHPEICAPDALRQIISGAKRDALVVDPWNCWGAAQVFAHADEVAALAGLGAR